METIARLAITAHVIVVFSNGLLPVSITNLILTVNLRVTGRVSGTTILKKKGNDEIVTNSNPDNICLSVLVV